MTTDRPAAGILETSVFIASETKRQLETALIPDEVAITVITLAELNAGVLAARTAAIAASKHLPVVTQDDDFDVLEGVAGLSIIRV